MIFSFDLRRARKGDCYLLHYGTKEKPGLAIIDGGPAQVYGPHLKPRIETIRAQRGLSDDQPLPVDLLMVSHIDDDHINGLLELTAELREATEAGQPLLLEAASFWHNSFDDIIGNNPKELLSSVTASLGVASLGDELEDIDPDDVGDEHSLFVLASVKQGVDLRNAIDFLGFPKNAEVGGELVMATEDAEPIDMEKGLNFTVVGPMKPELLKLQKDHDEFLKKQPAEKPQAALASFTDTSVANLSSIVVLAEVEGKKMLLTGDARGDKVLKGLELVGLLKAGAPLEVDILKMPHHGSDRNVDPIFFQRIKARHYVFSGDGEHGNPEREALQMLLDDRGDDDDYTVHLTYSVAEIDPERKATFEEEEEKKKKKGKPFKTWSDEEHSLKAFLKAHPKFKAKVRHIAKNEPHVIDLLDPLGY